MIGPFPNAQQLMTEMPLLQNWTSETLRLYPPFTSVPSVMVSDVQLKSNPNITLKKGEDYQADAM